jgi:hypothetical protein
MRKTLLLFIASSFLTVFSFGQQLTQNISGYVKDNTSNEALVGANIIVVGSSPLIGAVANPTGKFTIENVPVGYISLKISFIGYEEVELNSLELRTGKEMVINIFMDELALTGEEVIIRARIDKTGSINRMTSVSARTFTVEETRRYAGSRGDVARMATNYAGVQGASDDRNDIVIRGNSPAGLLWRLEGVEIPNPNHYGAFGTSGGSVSILNNNQLSNSDFLTSAFPAEYGNALSGVFDLGLRNGNSNRYEFLGQIGFNGFELGAEGPFSKKSDASFIVNYRHSLMGIFDLIGVSFGTGTAVPKYKDFSMKVNLPTKKVGTFSLFGVGGSSEIEFLDSERDTSEIDFYGGEGWDLSNGSDMMVIGLNHTINMNKTAFVKTSLAYSYHYFYVKTDSVVPDNDEIIPYYRSNFKESRILFSTFFKKRVNIKNNFQAGLNINFYFSNLNDSIFDAVLNKFTIRTSYQGNASLLRPYLSWQFKMSEKVVLNAGLHFQYYTYNNTSSLEPRFGASYIFGPNAKLSFGYGLHSQLLPTTLYNRETYVGPTESDYQLMNHDLEMVKSHHFVLGYDLNITKSLRLKAETYYQHIYNAAVNANLDDDYSSLNQGADFSFWNPDTLKSSGTGRNYGLEITLEQFLNNGFYFLFTGSLFESKYKGSDGIEHNTAFNTNFVSNGLVGKEWELHKNSSNQKLRSKQRFIGFDLKVNYAGGRRYTPIDEEQSKIERRPIYYKDQIYESQFPNYFRTDMKVFFKINTKKYNYEMAIDVQNIFNNQNIYSQNFNTSTGEIYNTYQLGVMVIPYFRIEF